jgi:lycopene beta-cyclase
LVSHRWQSVLLQTQDRKVKVDCRTAPYEMISAETFYAAALQKISQNPCIELATGTALTSEPWRDGDLWRIETTAGQHAGRILIDTRPNLPIQTGEAVLWQSFLGQEIECDESAFDPTYATLMKFLPVEDRRIPFVYVLPFSPKRALVEFTVFSPNPLGADELSQGLELGITAEVGAARHTVRRTEHGILPMGLSDPAGSAHKSFVRVGVMAGSARPSTGYSFQRIQTWAQACAASLARHKQPIPHQPDPLPLRLMDQIFLDVLKADPARGGAIFFALFR